MRRRHKKGIVLVTVMIVVILVAILAFVAIYIMGIQSRIGEHKVRRTRAYYAAMAAVQEAHAKLREDPNISEMKNVRIGDASDGYPYPIRVDITVNDAPEEYGWKNVKEIKATVRY